MIKRTLMMFLCLINISNFAYSEPAPCISLPALTACPNALPTNDVNFCASFKTAATCYCVASGVPSMLCQNMNSLYNRMVSIFGNVQKACEYQKYTPTQNCVDNWNCFMRGGRDSNGRLCSSTGRACQ